VKQRTVFRLVAIALLLLGGGLLARQTPGARPEEDSVGPNRPDEPLRKEFSSEAAVGFLDAVASNWQRQEKCVACHTLYPYLVARPTLGGDLTVHRQIRLAVEQAAAAKGGPKGGEPMGPTESVLLAASLAINDARTTGTLHPSTRRVLDRMWTLQRDDGTWQWPIGCKWPPSEIDEFFGVATAALAVGTAPGEYSKSPQAQKGLEKIRRFFGRNPPASAYQRGMLFWASGRLEGIMSEAQKKAAVEELLSLARSDGGWAFASLGNWQRSDGKPQDTQTSDGYGTGFAVYVLRMAGVPAAHPKIQKGIGWLKTHQRASGRWYTRSANKDSKHYVTHEGTAFALLALAACGEIRGATQF
jgi:squalene-hopene/tetraprenyl-beta-curcumene cyclase